MAKGKGRRAAERAERALGMPGGCFSGRARIEWCGGCASVEGCRGILAYEPEIIRMATADGEIRFLGRELCLRVLSDRYTEVTGIIAAVEMEESV